MRIRFRVWLCVALALGAMPAAAQPWSDFYPPTSPPGSAFDPPIKVVTIQDNGEWSAIACTYYSDVMIRIPDSDSPAPDNAEIIPYQGATVPPRCTSANPVHGITLPTEGYALSGRNGRFLVFYFADAVGVGDFKIFDVKTGHLLFEDGDYYAGAVVTFRHGILLMHYNRGINGVCSLLSGDAGCWAKLLANGSIPRGAFVGPPSREACVKAYGFDPAKVRGYSFDGDPNILSYDVTLTLDLAGHAKVQPVGLLQCDAPP